MLATLATCAIIAIFLPVPIEISFAQSDIDEAQDLYLAKRSFGDGFYEIALKHFQKYLQENPECDKGEVQVFIGRCFLKLNKFGEMSMIGTACVHMPELVIQDPKSKIQEEPGAQ